MKKPIVRYLNLLYLFKRTIYGMVLYALFPSPNIMQVEWNLVTRISLLYLFLCLGTVGRELEIVRDEHVAVDMFTCCRR
jgi:hypothetical protein